MRITTSDKYLTILTGMIDHPNFDPVDIYKTAEALHNIEFIYYVPNDDNRAEEGLALRERIFETYGLFGNIFKLVGDQDVIYVRNDEYAWGPCSVLEMMIALSERMEALLSSPNLDVPTLFWEMMSNLNLRIDTLGMHKDQEQRNAIIKDAISNLNNRTYNRNGFGGLFPLYGSRKDQRKVEIWYQMHAYLMENYY